MPLQNVGARRQAHGLVALGRVRGADRRARPGAGHPFRLRPEARHQAAVRRDDCFARQARDSGPRRATFARLARLSSLALRLCTYSTSPPLHAFLHLPLRLPTGREGTEQAGGSAPLYAGGAPRRLLTVEEVTKLARRTQKFERYRVCEADLQEELGRAPKDAELAARLGMPGGAREYRKRLSTCRRAKHNL